MTPITCQFQVRADVLGKKKDMPCNQNAGWFECRGALSQIHMPLCDRHADHCRKEYKWTVTAIQVEEAING